MRQITAAISIGLPKFPGSTIWSSGAQQHVIFLYKLLTRMPYIKKVWLVTDGTKNPAKAWLLNDLKDNIISLNSIEKEVDLLIELSQAVSPKSVNMVRRSGGKLVSYKVGNCYAALSENLIFNPDASWFPNPNGLQADAIWANPQFIDTCASLWEQLYGSKVAVLPHLWSPYFLNLALQDNPLSAAGWPYSGNSDNLKLSIFEPNISVVKNVIIPFYICSEFYKNNKDKINKIRMYNTLKLKDSSTFNRIVMGTDAGKESVATAEGRFSFPDAMGQEGGIIVSHQWENGLNYVYYEALYGGFPLVHNSPFLKDVGYYYEGFDINDGVKALERAVLEHDEMRDEYDKRAEAFLKTVDPSQKSVIDAYDREIRRLFSGTGRLQ
jgi:hypothetical protein